MALPPGLIPGGLRGGVLICIAHFFSFLLTHNIAVSVLPTVTSLFIIVSKFKIMAPISEKELALLSFNDKKYVIKKFNLFQRSRLGAPIG